MIVVRPMGGMGNQMYGLALGKALSLQTGAELSIDKSWMRFDGRSRRLDLDALKHFSHRIPEWTWSKSPVLRPFLGEKLGRVLWKDNRNSKSQKLVLIEPACEFDNSILEIKSKNIYVRGGTWQSFKYFEKFENTIKQMFTFETYLGERNRKWFDRIMALENCIAVHVRRGDYVSNPSASYTQGICTPEYYKNAIRYFEERIENPKFVFFSDDIEFAKSEFRGLSTALFIERPQNKGNEVGYRDDGHNDLFLMTHCKHFIVANSTFSWWAAYLSQSSNKTVVAPNKWYKGIGDDDFIIPASWVRING